MKRQSSDQNDQQAQFEQILDRLRVTPQRFLDLAHGIGREAVQTVDEAQPILVRPSRIRWPLTYLFQINIDKFNQSLRTAMDATGVGYCYIIKRRGKILHMRASGSAQIGADGPISWAPHIPMNMASVSKVVTAIALVKLIRDSEMSRKLKTPIAGFLPQYWVQGTGVGAITFRDLLRHEAGFGLSISNSGAGNFAEAKGEIASGPSATIKGKYRYKNVNFAILRILFVTLTGTLPPDFVAPSFLGLSEDEFWDAASALAYQNYVNDNVFVPATVDPRDFSAGTNAALAYATPPLAPGARIVDGPGGSGQSGWHMSIGELARLHDEFRTGAMMEKWRAQQVLSNRYGLDPPLTTSAGQVYTKGGRKLMGSQGMDSAIYLMPGDVNFAIYVNSWDGTQGGHLAGIPALIQSSVEFIF
jgi:CubicO group peptidase (beta-lactamase class C family)